MCHLIFCLNHTDLHIFCRLHQRHQTNNRISLVSILGCNTRSTVFEFLRSSFLAFVGITYQISGSAANERALLITEHMKAMGLYDSARIMCLLISPWDAFIELTKTADSGLGTSASR